MRGLPRRSGRQMFAMNAKASGQGRRFLFDPVEVLTNVPKIIAIPRGRTARIRAEIYGGGGGGGGGGYLTGGGSGGGGACSVAHIEATGPCEIVLRPGINVPGVRYGSHPTPANQGSPSTISVRRDAADPEIVIASVNGGTAGDANPFANGLGGEPSRGGTTTRLAKAVITASYRGGDGSGLAGQTGTFKGGAVAGPDGDATLNLEGAGARYPSANGLGNGLGGRGDTTKSGGSGATDSGYSGSGGAIYCTAR